MSADFMLDDSGICLSCTKKSMPTDQLQCFSCRDIFHVLCANATGEAVVATKTTVAAVKKESTRPNFPFLCNNCLTLCEIGKAIENARRIQCLELKLLGMDEKLSQVLYLMQKSSQRTDYSQVVKNQNIPKEQSLNKAKEATKSNSVLIIQNDSMEEEKHTRKVVEEIVIKNKVTLKNSYTNKSGNTVLICDTPETCNGLKSLVSSVKENVKLDVPSIKRSVVSIVGFEREYSSDELLQLFLDQNNEIRQFADSVENFDDHFKIRIIKSLARDETKYQAFCSVSTDLRNILFCANNKVILGLCCCRVYDQISVRRCYNCQEFGHHAAMCPTPDTKCCAKCSEAHNTKD